MRSPYTSEVVAASSTVGAVGFLVGFQDLTANAHHTGEYNTDQVKISNIQEQNSAIRLLEHEGVIQIGNSQAARNDKKIEMIRSHEPPQAGGFIYAAGEVGSIAIGAVVFGVAGYQAYTRLRNRFGHRNQLADAA